MKTFTCKRCGTEFQRPGCRTAVYCSNDCYHAAHHEGITSHRKPDHGEGTCQHCGEKFRIYRKPDPSRRSYAAIYCSNTCHNRAQAASHVKRHQGGNRRELDRMQQKRRNGALEIPCKICGFVRFIEICHIIPASKGGRHHPDNIMWLCPNHHRMYERNLLTEEEVSCLPLPAVDAYRSGNAMPNPSGPRKRPIA